jgi:epoxyqueuosine reductase
MSVIESTNNIKSFIHGLGIDIVGIANISDLCNMPVGLSFNLSDFLNKYPFAIVLGAQYGKINKKATGDETAVYLEKIAYDIISFLEKEQFRSLIIHPEDEYDPENRMGFLSLKVLAKQAGIGWQGRSLLIISPDYGPLHRLIAVLTDMPLIPDEIIPNMCGDCVVCIEKCPYKSLTLSPFDDHPNTREEILNIQTCLGDNGCMTCILRCPYIN